MWRDNTVIFYSTVYVFRAVHKFDFRIVTKETHNKWRLAFVKKLYHAMRESHVFDSSCIFFPDRPSRVLRDSAHAAQVNCILLGKRQ